MSDLPPAPPTGPTPGVPLPRPAPAKRPGALTGVAGILLVAGALSALFGLMGLSGEGLDIEFPFLEGPSAERVAASVLVVQGVAALLAGWLVLRLHPAGRTLGIVVASVGILTGLAQLRSTGTSGFLAIALDAFVLYGLFTYGFVFERSVVAR